MSPERALVLGAGLAGASVACALARRGWQVQVLDAAPEPAMGASSLPAGLMAPHLSVGDGPLSRITRLGLQATRAELARLSASGQLRPGHDWCADGVLEHRMRHHAAPTPSLGPEGPGASRYALGSELEAAGLPAERTGRDQAPAIWHPHAGWVRPAALVRAWLATPGVRFQGDAPIEGLRRVDGDWCALAGSRQVVARAPVVVVAAALGSAALCEGRLHLQPVRGQVSWGLRAPGDALPPFPVNGNGHLLPALPLPEGLAWLTGSTYSHADPDSTPRDVDHAANLERLHALLPQTAASLAPAFASGQARAWTGVRCASTDRRPVVGELAPGLWVSTAMGSRGLTLSALCAQLLCARLCNEALPLPDALAQALDVARQTDPRAGLRPRSVRG